MITEAEDALAELRGQEADGRREVASLDDALRTGRVIGLALGMLMTRHGMTHEETVSGLLRYSRRRHRKLRDLAAEVISLGDLIDFAEPGTAG